MARLPTPVIEGIEAVWPEDDWALREKNFYSILGQAIRNAATAEKIKDKGGADKEKSD